MPVIHVFFSPQTKCHTLYNIQVYVPEKKMNIWTTQRHRQQYRTKTNNARKRLCFTRHNAENVAAVIF
jgi:hypothetical protein